MNAVDGMEHPIFGREELYAREELLPSYAARSQKTRGRRHPEEGGDPRLAFQRDTDRILHSTAFRRLQYKTQVFVFHEGDFYRTRLTHSLEVVQIGRTLARLLGANEDLVAAISLAHDVGHPPFGHAGEEALQDVMGDYGGFEHNLQALRVVDELEERYPNYPGLNLTWETREGIARHYTFFDSPGEVPEFSEFSQPGFEAQISSVADMIAYSTHDLEDALYIGFVTEGELFRGIELWKRVAQKVQAASWERLASTPGLLGDSMRRFAIRNLIDLLIRDVTAQTKRRLDSYRISCPDDVRRAESPVVHFGDSIYPELDALRSYLSRQVYNDPRTLRMSNKARRIVKELFRAFLEEPAMLPRVTLERVNRGRELHRVIADYIAGMTDRYAMDLFNTLFEPYESSLRGLR